MTLQAMTSTPPDFIDQRIVVDANQMSVSLGTVLFGGEARTSLFQVSSPHRVRQVCPQEDRV